MSPLTNLIGANFRYDALYETDRSKNMPTFSWSKKRIDARAASILGAALIGCVLSASPAGAEEMHPLLNSKYWVKVGAYFASRDTGISASGSVGIASKTQNWDSSAGLDDTSDLFTVEFGWQFAKKWDFAMQHWRSSRNGRKVLSETIEWEDVEYEAGVDIETHTSMTITRMFFSRRFWDKGPHDFRVGAGLHLIDMRASIRGEATLDDMTTQFQASVVSAQFPFPDIGAWYRYSLSDRWLFYTRVDWLSASTSDYAGGIWNAAAGVDFSLTKNLGFGLAYQYFEINGTVKEDTWRGELHSRYEGFMLSIDGFW